MIYIMSPRQIDSVTLLSVIFFVGLIVLFVMLRDVALAEASVQGTMGGVVIFPYLFSLLFFLPWTLRSIVFMHKNMQEFLTTNPSCSVSYYLTFLLLYTNLLGITISLLEIFGMISLFA